MAFSWEQTFYCPMCKEPMTVAGHSTEFHESEEPVSAIFQPGEKTKRTEELVDTINLECIVCPDLISCTIEVGYKIPRGEG